MATVASGRQIHGEELTSILDSTGIPWKRGYSPNHLNILPRGNLKPWSPDQQAAIEQAVIDAGGRITHAIVRKDFTTFNADPGRGFRVY